MHSQRISESLERVLGSKDQKATIYVRPYSDKPLVGYDVRIKKFDTGTVDLDILNEAGNVVRSQSLPCSYIKECYLL